MDSLFVQGPANLTAGAAGSGPGVQRKGLRAAEGAVGGSERPVSLEWSRGQSAASVVRLGLGQVGCNAAPEAAERFVAGVGAVGTSVAECNGGSNTRRSCMAT